MSLCDTAVLLNYPLCPTNASNRLKEQGKLIDSMKKRLIGFATLMLLLILLGCSASQQVESRFRERVLPGLGISSALDKFGIRYFDEGAIVVFTGDESQRAGYAMMGYSVFHRDLGTWRSGQSGGRGRQQNDSLSTYLDYFITDFNFQERGVILPLTIASSLVRFSLQRPNQ